MSTIDWFALLHPVLVILFVYPLMGATVRLGLLVREKRLGITKQPEPVPQEHADHGLWLTAGVILAVLIALVYSFSKAFVEAGADFSGGASRYGLLLLVSAGSLVALAALMRVRRAVWRASFALLCWAGVLGLGSQAEIWRLSDNPFSAGFWSSHYWAGVLLSGLLLFTLSARPEIKRNPRLRRLHISANVLILLLFAVQGVSGTRDLLQIGGN
ncbi:DUF4079 domain-containing protein [Synechococcus sp. A10-1-5-1]|uniref:DUF4079 domain-containing protein n=1 Tax=Synechococcus sp. A10-1-5-1 TaxID=2936507 RepID=UPI00200060D3|nr:DUF4079 domain-containing protein [Synechococcus sp. A10-1-5-1]UPM49720.1 DUF4079 domain-containing protein [Synechococcus sp. A10-1-5-1]